MILATETHVMMALSGKREPCAWPSWWVGMKTGTHAKVALQVDESCTWWSMNAVATNAQTSGRPEAGADVLGVAVVEDRNA